MRTRVSTPQQSTTKGLSATKRSSAVATFITGKDLRVMRLRAEITTAEMAQKIGVKSRKTIENWEQQQSEPTINVFIQYCVIAGFNPARIITEILKRNQQDPTQKQYYNLDSCADHGGACQFKLRKQLQN